MTVSVILFFPSLFVCNDGNVLRSNWNPNWTHAIHSKMLLFQDVIEPTPTGGYCMAMTNPTIAIPGGNAGSPVTYKTDCIMESTSYTYPSPWVTDVLSPIQNSIEGF